MLLSFNRKDKLFRRHYRLGKGQRAPGGLAQVTQLSNNALGVSRYNDDGNRSKKPIRITQPEEDAD
jgi:hypothetical protein